MSGERRGREWLAAHLPHRGAMSLLDEVLAWDDERLHARASRHRDAAHPLRRDAMLPAVAAIEYAAQAAAAHGALLGARGDAAGFLVSAREVRFEVDRLDDVDHDLDVVVERAGGGASGVLYRFTVSAAGRALAAGRVAIALDPARIPVARAAG